MRASDLRKGDIIVHARNANGRPRDTTVVKTLVPCTRRNHLHVNQVLATDSKAGQGECYHVATLLDVIRKEPGGVKVPRWQEQIRQPVSDVIDSL